MKRVYCLYRVSTKGQVIKDDIPMQRQECEEFCQRNGWQIVKEFCEKGISGHKVSANDRDAIQDLKAAAERHEFDVLLVFMFDRVGRIQNETPFVVEWFVQHGIEVWSAKEGQQRFENDVDYLLNYMRFWQADGESRKTSMRVKTRMNQLANDGVYMGGMLPVGYKLARTGVYKKNGREMQEIEIDEVSAAIVRIVFEKTVHEGYGSHRLATFLNKKGLRTRKGAKFQCNNVMAILRNRMYCGYVVFGETVSKYLPRLQIIEEALFEQAQFIVQQRADVDDNKKQIARNTKGQTLLSGNIYCAHCGGHLIATTKTDRYTRADGTVVVKKAPLYMCAQKARQRGECNGQGGYTADKIDAAVEAILTEYFHGIRTTPKDVAIELRYQRGLQESYAVRKRLEDDSAQLQRQQKQLEDEVGKSLMGESQFTPETLASAIEGVKRKIRANDQQLVEVRGSIENQSQAMKMLDYYYDQFRSWAELYFTHSSMEEKKMIACQLIREIRVGKGYKLAVALDVNYEQFLEDGIDTAKTVEGMARIAS